MKRMQLGALGFAVLALLLAPTLGAAAGRSLGGAPDIPAYEGAIVSPESVYNGTVQLSCTDWVALNTGSHVLDRDNTGTGNEALRIDITDGNGTLIYTLTYQNVLGTYTAGIGNDSYTSAPQANPITFTLTSLAGNGLPEQVDFVGAGACQSTLVTLSVPTLSGVGLATLALLLGGLALFAVRRTRRPA